MLKAREILRLKFEVGLSVREIGKACNCGKSTVSELLTRAQKAEISWPIELTDKQLMSALYPPTETSTSPPEPDMEYIPGDEEKEYDPTSSLGGVQRRIFLWGYVHTVL